MSVHIPDDMRKGALTYCSILEEIKQRHSAIDTLIAAEIQLPEKIRIESGVLQLRFMCEALAIGCLILHGNIPSTKKSGIYNNASANDIIKALENLHAQFFPIPAKVDFKAPTKSMQMTYSNRSDESFLTKAGLILLYGKCNSYLHRGSLKNIEKKRGMKFTITEINEWRSKFVSLLSYHVVNRADLENHYLFSASEKSTNGKADWRHLKGRINISEISAKHK